MISRGKDDKIDATKITQYGYRLRDEIRPYIMTFKDITKLKRLLSLRERLVKQRAGYKSSLKEFLHILTLKKQ
ncbi:IS110 family transposase [Flavobacterium sp.]|uniref:IS110 family transposase n=1 Tax=Flavobacterium sp. TaxID=239 RepID=UPI004047C988